MTVSGILFVQKLAGVDEFDSFTNMSRIRVQHEAFLYLLRTIRLPIEYPAPKEQITPMSPLTRS
jgi:hypothetical protein